jgi:hypothetical protein
VRPDELVFADMTNTRFFVTREEDVSLSSAPR